MALLIITLQMVPLKCITPQRGARVTNGALGSSYSVYKGKHSTYTTTTHTGAVKKLVSNYYDCVFVSLINYLSNPGAHTY